MKKAWQFYTGKWLLGSGLPYVQDLLAANWTTGGTALHGGKKWIFEGVSRALDERYYRLQTSSAERERLKALCMSRESAVVWAKAYLKRGFPEPQTEVIAMFNGIEHALKSGEVRRVHQVACCSAREIAWFARRYPSVQFTGSDCDADLIEFLKNHWKGLENLNFEILRMDSPPETLSCDLMYASGGFHYLDPETLKRFLAWAHARVSHLYLSQPLDRTYDPDSCVPSIGRGMLSWNHPYTRLLNEAGFASVTCKEGTLVHLRDVKNYSAFASLETSPKRLMDSL